MVEYIVHHGGIYFFLGLNDFYWGCLGLCQGEQVSFVADLIRLDFCIFVRWQSLPILQIAHTTMSLSQEELALRLRKIQAAMEAEGCESLLLRSVPSQLYLAGTVCSGWIYVPLDGAPLFFPDRLTAGLSGYDPERIIQVRKPELIPSLLSDFGYRIDRATALEKGYLTVIDYERLVGLSSGGGVSDIDAAQLMRRVRMIKTAEEIRLIRESAARHTAVYEAAPALYERGMTDLEWQHAIEYEMRREGWIGLLRTYGTQLESCSGLVLAGDNALAPGPYDFTLGGRGTDGYPLGASGHLIRSGESVMIDLAGDFTPYQTDCTRTFYLDEISDEAHRYHEMSLRMHEWLEEVAMPGFPIAEIYRHAHHLAQAWGVAEYFMGAQLQARYVGHGVGLEINELPILTGCYPGALEEGMVIAFEPKLVLPSVGALGIEDTYLVHSDGVECLTTPERTLVRLG